jgi:hypothetical protein
VYAQVATEANKPFRTPEDRKAWLEQGDGDPDKPSRLEDARAIIEAIGLKPGMTVVEVGTGWTACCRLSAQSIPVCLQAAPTAHVVSVYLPSGFR